MTVFESRLKPWSPPQLNATPEVVVVAGGGAVSGLEGAQAPELFCIWACENAPKMHAQCINLIRKPQQI